MLSEHMHMHMSTCQNGITSIWVRDLFMQQEMRVLLQCVLSFNACGSVPNFCFPYPSHVCGHEILSQEEHVVAMTTNASYQCIKTMQRSCLFPHTDRVNHFPGRRRTNVAADTSLTAYAACAQSVGLKNSIL
jgi:hypothetical protein